MLIIRIRESDDWKTAFNTTVKPFEYQVMPFGQTNIPVVFITLVNNVLQDMLK